MKIKYLLGMVLAAFVATSCSEDQMDNINKDEAHPGLNIVNGKFQITDAITSSVYSTICGNYAWYVSSYTEQLFGTGNNQLKNVEVRLTSEMSANSTFNNEWNSTYLNLNNLVNLRNKCADGGVNAGYYDLLGMEEVLEALNWGILTDLHGDIPYEECFTGVSAPKINTQDEVYKHIFELLDDAQANLNTAISSKLKNAATQDILFQGDLTQWLGLAHALKARYLLHTYGQNKTTARLDSILTEANAAVAAGFEGANFDVFNGKTADNSWSAYWWSRYYIGSSQTVDALLTERNDPREAIYNFDMFGSNTIGIPGTSEQAVLTETLNAPAWLENGAAYLHLFSKSELYFIIAEVKARLGQDAKSDFETAVSASLDDYNATGGGVAEVTIDETAKSNYLASLTTLYTANPLNEILIQKYIAQTRDEQLETYNDIRRCRYVDGSYPVTLTNPNNVQSGSNRWPLRLPYGESDVVSNPNVTAAFGSGTDAGMYIFTAPVRWAGGSK
ncbi:MAG: SusD/RagB family nutrient-binding outer membrane lipoprotein [Prevotella sp.]|nr:SusD/RagB family nutrient-binding outer membrane lipoprotein [Prevotella sp.]